LAKTSKRHLELDFFLLFVGLSLLIGLLAKIIIALLLTLRLAITLITHFIRLAKNEVLFFCIYFYIL